MNGVTVEYVALFENRGARRTISVIDLEYAAVLGLAGGGCREGS
jgi:hypothetical protein